MIRDAGDDVTRWRFVHERDGVVTTAGIPEPTAWRGEETIEELIHGLEATVGGAFRASHGEQASG